MLAVALVALVIVAVISGFFSLLGSFFETGRSRSLPRREREAETIRQQIKTLSAEQSQVMSARWDAVKDKDWSKVPETDIEKTRQENDALLSDYEGRRRALEQRLRRLLD